MRFFYLRDVNGHPVACLATELHKATGQIKTDMVSYALSVCNPQDHFKREQARALAAGRLATANPKRYIPITTDDNGQVKLRILAAVANGPFPQRARDAATRWLLLHAAAKLSSTPSHTAAVANAAVQAGDPKPTDRPSGLSEKGIAAHQKMTRRCPVCGWVGGKHSPVCLSIKADMTKKKDPDAHLGAVETVRGEIFEPHPCCPHVKTDHYWHGTQSAVLWGYCQVTGCSCKQYVGPGARSAEGWDKKQEPATDILSADLGGS